MKKVNLMELIGKDVKGIKANVRRQGGLYHYDYQDIPMIRTLSKVYLKYVKDDKGIVSTWLFWEWEPKSDTTVCPGSNYPVNDCGYSGIGNCELHPINEAFIFVE